MTRTVFTSPQISDPTMAGASAESVFASWPGTAVRFTPPGSDLSWMALIRESRATCSDCIRCHPDSVPQFKPRSKCCTHVPWLPNFSVGEILNAGGPGADIARTRIHSLASWPLGLRPTPIEEHTERARGPGGFGIDDRVVCPFLIGRDGTCSAWASRPAECASYFCETSNFDNGRSLWRRARDYFSFVETTLAAEALAQRGFLEDEISACWAWLPRENAESMGGAKFDEALQRTLWLEFDSDREGFFLKAAETVATLSQRAVWDLMGDQGDRLWRDIEGVGRATVR